jgi:hypothetical protein
MNISLLRRDRLSRAGLLLLSGVLLAAAAGLSYVGYLAWSGEAGAGLPLFGLGAWIAWAGLFALKRAVLPVREEQDPPVIAFD